MARLWPLALAVSLVVLAGGAAGQDVPVIYLYVNDLADPGVLLNVEEDALTELCFDVDAATSAEIAILVVNTTLPLGINMFAVETFEQNGVGKEGLDNGVLIVVSTDEREWRIEVGYGLEGALPNAKVGRIGTTTLSPALAAGDYYGGLYDATSALREEILANYTGPPSEPALWVVDWWQVAFGVAVFLGVAYLSKGRVFLWVVDIFRRGGFGGGRSGGAGARKKF